MLTRMWIVFSFYTIMGLSLIESQGSANPCGKETPVAYICTSSTITMTSRAFIYISNLPVQNETACTCSVSPISRNVNVHLRYRLLTLSAKSIRFKIDGKVLNESKKSATTMLSEIKELLLELIPVFDTEESQRVCLLLQTGEDKFLNISCEKNTLDAIDSATNDMTYSTELNAIRTTLIPKPAFDSDRSTKSSNDDESESSISGVIIGIVVVGDVVIFVLIIVAIWIYRRRIVNNRKKDSPERRTSKHEDVVAERNDGDDSDYYMTENPLYNMTEPTTMMTDTTNYKQLTKNTQFVQRMEDNDNNVTTGEYDFIPDSSNDVTQPLMSDTANENNINDSQKFDESVECEYTEIGHVEEANIPTPCR